MSLNFLRNLFLSICLFLATQFVKAQGGNTNYFQPNIFPLSPNSTAFTKFGNYPVNLYTGLPDISIPLYTVEVGGLSVPITLSYHASGNKVADVSSWVGLGWSINTGGSITRVINGLPDDNGYLQGDMKKPADLHPESNNNDIDWLRETVENKAWDNMPDIYSYQIPGYSGKFFFDGTNKYKIEKIPFSAISISGLTGLNGTGGFHITDDHGNKFSLGQNYVETTSFNHGAAISAWMLEQMISQSRRDTVNFSYTSDNFQFPDALSENIAVEDGYNTDTPPGNLGYLNPVNPSVSILNNPTTVIEQQLSSITFKNGRVDFILSPYGRSDIGANANQIVKSLDTLKVSAYNFGTKKMEVQKKVVFFKSYFNEGVNGAQRLKLDSIEILDKAGTIMQHYRFTYNTSVNLPAYLSFGRDLWGYFNGKINNIDLVPQMNIQITTPTNLNNPISYMNIGSNDPTSRDPDSTFMQADILTRVDYPTGGYSTFTYQTNRYPDASNVIHLAGGLRVSSISHFDSPLSTTPTMIKTYQYNTARANFIYLGAFTMINYGLFSNSQTYRYWKTIFDTHGVPFGISLAYHKVVRNFFSEPNMDLAPDAIPVAYSNVTEYDGTPANNIGKTVYTFRDSPSDNYQAASSSGIPISYSFSFSRGQLSDKATYMRKSDGTYQIVKDESNTYSAFPVKYYGGVGLAIGQLIYNDGDMNGGSAYPHQESPDDYSSNAYPYGYYGIVSDDNVMTGSTNKTYDMADISKYVTSSATYNYDDTTHMQMVTSSHTDSKVNTRTLKNVYPYNYAAGNAVIDTMVNRNMFAEVIEKTETYTTSSGTSTTASQLNQFQFGNIATSVLPCKISVLNISSPVTDFTASSVVSGSLTSDSRYTQMISFDQFDNNNNISQFTPRNSTPISILWDYLGELPVAQIKNATNSNTNPQVAYTSFEAPRNTGFQYSGAPVSDPTAPSGSMVYPLSGGSINFNAYDATQSYILSIWSNSGAPTVYALGYRTGTPLRSANGWTYYEYQIPAYAGNIAISGTSSVDELRLFPAASQMTTYAYDPSGLRSITDTKGQISFFEYDPFQRLKNIKDWNGNIVKNFGYHTYDQIIPNDAIPATTFTRKTCPPNTTPQSTTYSVPAAKYVSSTKISANLAATYDLNTNGQLKANNPANCGCPVQTVAFTLSNTTGLAFQAQFQGGSNPPPYNFPTDGSTITVYVPVGNYTIYIGAVGSALHSFTYGSQTQSGVHSASFTGVTVSTTGGNPTNLSIQ